MAANRQALERIVAVLLALADVAERAGARPRPVLMLVLCILRPAEALARQFVFELSRPATLQASFFEDAVTGAAYERAEAFRLAVVFRLLAAMLACLDAAAGPLPGLPPSRPRQAKHPIARILAGPVPAWADTS